MGFSKMTVGIITDCLQFLSPFLDVQHVRLSFYGIETFHLLTQSFLSDTVDTSIAHCRQQIVISL